MDNIVSLEIERPRPRRDFGPPRDGAQILFFTGIRYCRDEEDLASSADHDHALPIAASARALDVASH